jgi:O-antigen/teichoic acid export membrane protein
MLGCAVLRDLALVLVPYRRFFATCLRRPPGDRFDWRREIWPLQWRLALQGLSQFGAAQTFTPVLLYFEGPGPAGRMGMTWSAVGGIQSVALAWIQVRVPALGRLVAIGDRIAFERLWQHASALSVGMTAAAGGVFCAAIAALAASRTPFALRLLAVWPTILLVLGICCAQIVQCLAVYVRAHKSEALMRVGVTSSIVVAALAVILGSRLGGFGIAIGYLVSMGAVALPMALVLWHRFRQGLKAPHVSP